MFSSLGRRTAVPSLCAFVALLFSTRPSSAVIVRGTVTDPLGAAIANARVELIQGRTVAAFTVSGPDGAFEIRSTEAGRFLLLTAASSFTPSIGTDFYGGHTDVVTRNVVMELASVTEQVTVTATGIPTPIQQASSPVTLIPANDLETRVGIVDDLRLSPGTEVVQTGQTGGVTSLFVRGGNSDSNKVLIDGISAEDIGGRFDFGTVSTTGLAGIELYRGPNSVLYGSDALASVVNLATPRGEAIRPVLNYSGDAGNFHTWRNEASVSGAHSRLDYLAAFSRFDTSNALPLDRYHSATSAANLGYNLTASTQTRFTLRSAVSATGTLGAHDFFAISSDGKQQDQDLYSGITVENHLRNNWHNLIRYGIARKREQELAFAPVGQPVVTVGPGYSYTTYYGNSVTLRGANGYQGTGQAAINYDSTSPSRSDSVSNRDELYFQSDYSFTHHLTALLAFRYQNERGSFVFPAYFEDQRSQRTNLEYTLQFQGDIKNRLFYSLGGSIERNHLYGTAGTPRIGLACIPVRPSARRFRGTTLRATYATGVQEPSLSAEFTSLYGQLLNAGNTAAIAAYRVTPINALRSRTYDIGIDQHILSEKLVLKLGYFHNTFDHQIEYVDSGTLQKFFGIQSSVAQLYGADLNSLAFRAQGIEAEIQYQPLNHIFLRGGYTYLDAVVRQSFSTDAIAAGTATVNPNYPNIPIGGTSPLVGARPFRRPPNTGYFTSQYVTTKFSAALKGALASRSDDSTFLSFSDINGDNTLLLPNRNLDFGYAKLDANFSYTVTHHVTVFTQLDNLLSQQHIGPIGYPALPFSFRSGLKLRLGGA